MTTEKGRIQLRIEHFSHFIKSVDYTKRESEAIMLHKLPWIIRVRKNTTNAGIWLFFSFICDLENSGKSIDLLA